MIYSILTIVNLRFKANKNFEKPNEKIIFMKNLLNLRKLILFAKFNKNIF